MRFESADFFAQLIQSMNADQALLRQELAAREQEYAPLLRRIAQEHAADMERLKTHLEEARQAPCEARVA